MTTIDQQDALLRDICQRPDDTQARLVFADWCEDNGQEARGEFVRVQVELSILPPALPEIEGHIVEWNAHAGQPVNFAVLIRREDVPPGPFIIRHQLRDDSWFESSPALIKSVEEFDPDRVKARCVFHECDTSAWQRSQALRCRERKLFLDGYARGPCGLMAAAMSGYSYLLPAISTFAIRDRESDDVDRWRFVWRNGFVESITTTSTAWFAHGPQIVAATPVRTVRLTDKRPGPMHGTPGRRWWSAMGNDGSYSADVLPEFLFDLLSGFSKGYAFADEQAALAALSAAAVAWARRQAGL